MEYTKSPIDTLNNLNIQFSLGPWMLWAVFFVFMTVYSIITIILVYHWIAYGMRAKGIFVSAIIFPTVSVFLVLVALSGLALF